MGTALFQSWASSPQRILHFPFLLAYEYTGLVLSISYSRNRMDTRPFLPSRDGQESCRSNVLGCSAGAVCDAGLSGSIDRLGFRWLHQGEAAPVLRQFPVARYVGAFYSLVLRAPPGMVLNPTDVFILQRTS